MTLKCDKERKKSDKASNAEELERREALHMACRARADVLRGLIGALVSYQDGGNRYGYLYSVSESGLEAKVERIMPLGCKTKPEMMSIPCVRIEAKDYTREGKPRKTWDNTAYAINTQIQAAAADVDKIAALTAESPTGRLNVTGPELQNVPSAAKPAASEFAAKVVELYKANPGIKIGALAQLLGYGPNQGQNRTRGALKAAGLLQ